MIGQAIAVSVMFAIVLGGLIYQWRSGLLTAAAFIDAPPRRGMLGFHDIAITLGLYLLGSIGGASAAMAFIGESRSPSDTLILVAASQAGTIPMIGYVMARAHLAVEGGLGGFGFSLERINRSLDSTIGVGLFIIPATLVTLAASAIVTTAIGYPPPKLAHTMFESMLNARSTGVRLGLVLLPILAAPVVEEVLFRGLLQTAVRHVTGMGRWPVIAVFSVVFMLVHGAAVPWQSMPGLFVLSLGLGFAYERTGKLWSPMLIHGVFNALNVALALSGAIRE